MSQKTERTRAHESGFPAFSCTSDQITNPMLCYVQNIDFTNPTVQLFAARSAQERPRAWSHRKNVDFANPISQLFATRSDQERPGAWNHSKNIDFTNPWNHYKNTDFTNPISSVSCSLVFFFAPATKLQTLCYAMVQLINVSGWISSTFWH